MGRTLRSAVAITGLAVGVGLSFGAMSRAADEPPPTPFDQIRDMIPPTGQAFTSDNRFQVDTRGVVAYYGFMPQEGVGPQNHSSFIGTGVSLDSGGSANVDGDNRNAGTVDLGDDLPVKFSANATVNGELTSDNLAPCVGEGNIEVIGNGLTDPVGIAAMVLLGGGLVGLLLNARPAMTYRRRSAGSCGA